ncbi:GNAT family N-acetyltransferase [Actinoplanes sp. CA-030573]|uniref:GNAT family N-acetyltransferase n=1 Tax=Actinoplanes sp. CA-030573 TaxID=3239898 RepID=UPI003D923E47
MRPSLERGDVWLLYDDASLVGTVTVETEGDADFWSANELAQRAGYVSKLAVRRARAGEELGKLLLGWAGDHAYRFGCDWLRLDAWKNNEALHTYYAERGWTFLRTVDVPNRHSGTLFQQATMPLDRISRQLLSEVPNIPTIDSLVRVPPEPVDPAGNWRPGHTHECQQFQVSYEWLSGPRPLLIVPGYRYEIRHDGREWKVYSGQPGTAWREVGELGETSMTLNPKLRYVFTHDDGEPCAVRLAAVDPHGPLSPISLTSPPFPEVN